MILEGAVIPADRCREQTISVQGEAIEIGDSECRAAVVAEGRAAPVGITLRRRITHSLEQASGPWILNSYISPGASPVGTAAGQEDAVHLVVTVITRAYQSRPVWNDGLLAPAVAR